MPSDGLQMTVECLHEFAAANDLTCFGNPAYGWHGKSIGSAATCAGKTVWVKLCVAEQEFDGETDPILASVPCRPKVLQVFDRQAGTVPERLIVMEFAPDPVAGPMPWNIDNPELITAEYLDRLRDVLLHLGCIETERVNTRFDLVQRRIQEFWTLTISPEDCKWQTIHGDLHWANLTVPGLCVLDWERWGTGLMLQDFAFLMALSGLYPEVQVRIASAEPDLVSSRRGSFSLMFVTAELLCMNKMHGQHPELVSSLLKLGAEARQRWVAR